MDTIVLLTGPIEAAALAGVLRIRNPRIDVRHAATLAELESLTGDELARARLIAFSTDIIVPPRILDALGFGAYNFHLGPPDYPGWCPAPFAVYDGAATFGVTAHSMLASVDSGPIVGVELFAVPPGTTVAWLEQMAFVVLARLFWTLAEPLTQSAALAELPLSWSGAKSTRQLYQNLRDVPATVSKNELDRRVAVFAGGETGADLYITLHGHRFAYVAPENETTADVPALPAIERVARRA